MAPELLQSLAAVVTSMAAAQHGAWNGELGHNCILCRDSHWDLVLGVGTGMGAGGAEEEGGWGAPRTGKLDQIWEAFRLHRLEGLPLGRQKAEKCDYTLQGSMLSSGKGGGPVPAARLISKPLLP